jgi:hypothetical protein
MGERKKRENEGMEERKNGKNERTEEWKNGRTEKRRKGVCPLPFHPFILLPLLPLPPFVLSEIMN